MIIEEAYYFQLLLSAGFDDGYDAWLDWYLDAEDPLSDIVLDLALCGSDINRTISCLQQYCCGQEIDERAVSHKLRLFLKDAYHNGKMDKEAVVSAMYRITCAHGDSEDEKFDLWGDWYYMDDCYGLAKDGMIPWNRFDEAFARFLNYGISLDGTIWHRGTKQKESLFTRIKNYFKK